MERRIRDYQSRWLKQKPELQCDMEFLSRWLELLETHPKYGARMNRAGIAMLRHLLGRTTGGA